MKDKPNTLGALGRDIAACMYPIPDGIAAICDKILPDDLREINDKFIETIH
jgi:hypothetical protein